MNRLYPYKIEAKLVPAIWGGDALVQRYGKVATTQGAIGESWECWSENRVLNGDCAGETIGKIWTSSGPALLGLAPVSSRTHFPILTKLIDAKETLSVQVHPDDTYAKQVEDQPNGKTECWVILEAAPDAEIVLGFAKDATEADVRRRARDGSLNDILRRIKVKAGDVFFIPAGTVHAIGAGIVLFETQQASDLTYRLFDWNRKDATGKSRELHLDKAAAVLRYEAETSAAITPLEYRIEGADRRCLITDERFGVEEIVVQKSARLLTESVCIALTAKETAIQVRTPDIIVDIEPWSTVLIPAGIPRVELMSATETSVFLVTPPGATARLRSRLDLIGFAPEKLETFLAQFPGQPASV